MKKKLTVGTLVLVALFIQLNVAYALSEKTNKPIKITIDSPQNIPFYGYTADIAENGELVVNTYTDPSVFAAINGMSLAEVVDPSDKTSTIDSASQSSDSKINMRNNLKNEDEFTVASTYKARVTAFSQILDSVNLVMNELMNRQEFTYDFNYVRSSSGSTSAWCLGSSGWTILWGPTKAFGNSLPARSQSQKCYASYRNSTWPGGPYQNAIENQTVVHSDGNVNAGHTFYVDPKGSTWLWKVKGWHSRTQL